jgi:hypothetical protein
MCILDHGNNREEQEVGNKDIPELLQLSPNKKALIQVKKEDHQYIGNRNGPHIHDEFLKGSHHVCSLKHDIPQISGQKIAHDKACGIQTEQYYILQLVS